MGKPFIEIANFEDIQLFIRQESKETERIGMQTIKRTGLHIMDTMKQLIEPAVVTGRLRASVHIASENNNGHSYSDEKGNTHDGTFSEAAKDGEVLVGTNVIYAESANERSRAKGYFERSAASGDTYIEKELRRKAK